MENCKMKHLRHMLVVVDQEGLTELQNRNSSYFIEKVNAVSENLNKTEIDEIQNKIIKDIIKNYNICRRFYKTLFNSVTNNFFEYVSAESYLEVNEINEDFKTIGWGLTPDVREYQGNVELLNSWTFFYYINGRFSALDELVHAPNGASPKCFYELFRGTRSHGLVCTQLLAVLNIFFE